LIWNGALSCANTPYFCTALGINKAAKQQSHPLSKEFLKLQKEISVLQNLNDPLNIYARLPFNLKVE
jgi:protease IV